MWREGWLDSTTFPPAPPTPAPPPPPGPPPPPHPQVCQPPSNTPPVSSSYTFLHGGAGVISNNGALFWLCSGSVLAHPVPAVRGGARLRVDRVAQRHRICGQPVPAVPTVLAGLVRRAVGRVRAKKGSLKANGGQCSIPRGPPHVRLLRVRRTCGGPTKIQNVTHPFVLLFSISLSFSFPQVREREGGGGHVLPCVVQGGRGLLDVHGRAGGRPRLRQPGRRHRCHHHPRQVQGRARCLLGRKCCPVPFGS